MVYVRTVCGKQLRYPFSKICTRQSEVGDGDSRDFK